MPIGIRGPYFPFSIMKYTPHSESEIQAMLEELGLTSLDDLFADIPAEILRQCELPKRAGLTEMEVRRDLAAKAAKNSSGDDTVCFAGGGCYDAFIPAAVGELSSREEFFTAYTPYQPEISQGILQAIFEYQTYICRLTGLDVANASLYDGATALASACAIAAETTKKTRILLPQTLHEHYAQVVETYAISGTYSVESIPERDGVTDRDALEKALDETVAAVVIPYPNFYGILEPVGEIIAKVREKSNALVIMQADPVALAILKSPGDWGADIAVGNGQPLGNPMSYGGPHLGFMAVTEKLMRKIPGRLVGETVDAEGRRAFVLTLQAREQHIRREKASSNICSNQALNALAASMYLAFVGPDGFRQAAERSHKLALYAKKKFLDAGFELRYDQPFFREFAIKAENPDALWSEADVQYSNKIKALDESSAMFPAMYLLPGLSLADGILFAFTEKRTVEEIDLLVEAFAEARN